MAFDNTPPNFFFKKEATTALPNGNGHQHVLAICRPEGRKKKTEEEGEKLLGNRNVIGRPFF